MNKLKLQLIVDHFIKLKRSKSILPYSLNIIYENLGDIYMNRLTIDSDTYFKVINLPDLGILKRMDESITDNDLGEFRKFLNYISLKGKNEFHIISYEFLKELKNYFYEHFHKNPK